MQPTVPVRPERDRIATTRPSVRLTKLAVGLAGVFAKLCVACKALEVACLAGSTNARGACNAPIRVLHDSIRRTVVCTDGLCRRAADVGALRIQLCDQAVCIAQNLCDNPIRLVGIRIRIHLRHNYTGQHEVKRMRRESATARKWQVGMGRELQQCTFKCHVRLN